MTNNTTETPTPTTVPPCPDWCVWGDRKPAHAAGNDFETLNSGEGMVRNHEGPTIGVEPYTFLVATEETMRHGVVETSPAYIYFDVEYERLTAEQVRHLGTLLLAVADQLDEINGAK